MVRLGNRTSSTFFCRKQPDLCCNSSNTDVEHTSNRLAGCFVVPDVEDAALRVAIFALGIQADNPRSYLQLALQGDSRYNKYMAAVNNRKHELGLVSDVDAFRFAHVLDELLEKAPYSVLLPEPRFIEGEVDWTLKLVDTCAPHYEADFDYWAWRCLLRTYDDLKEAFKLQDFEGKVSAHNSFMSLIAMMILSRSLVVACIPNQCVLPKVCLD